MTPFEEFLFWDAKIPGSPADAVTHMVFRGLMDRRTLERAFYALIKETPRAVETVVERENGETFWQTRSEYAEKVRLPLGEPFLRWYDQSYDARTPLEPLCITHTPGLRLTVFRDENAGRTDVFLQFNHVATDAGGSLQFLSALFERYAKLAAGEPVPSGETQQKPLPASLGKVKIDARLAWLLAKEAVRWGFYVLNPWRTRVWRIKPPQTPTAVGHRWEPGETPAAPFTREHFFSCEETASIRQTAKRLGVTVNDLLVTACFRAAHRWRLWRDGPRRKPLRVFYRMAVPVNLRDEPAKFGLLGNVVSILFLDCRPRACEKLPPLELLKRNAATMRKLKRTGAARVMLRAIQGLHDLRWGKKRQRWGAELYLRHQPAYGSFVLSNLGVLFSGCDLPRTPDGKLCVADLVLDDIRLASPRTINTALFFPIATYANQLRLTAVYDPQRISPLEADRWLEFMAEELIFFTGNF